MGKSSERKELRQEEIRRAPFFGRGEEGVTGGLIVVVMKRHEVTSSQGHGREVMSQ